MASVAWCYVYYKYGEDEAHKIYWMIRDKDGKRWADQTGRRSSAPGMPQKPVPPLMEVRLGKLRWLGGRAAGAPEAGTHSGRRDDRERFDRFRPLLPAFPQPGEGEQVVVLAVDVEWLSGLRVEFLPFVEPTGGNQAAPVPEGGAEGGLLRNRFCPRVDQPVADLAVGCPGRDQSPAGDHALARTVGLPDDGMRLRGGNVVTRSPGPLRQPEQIEEVLNLGRCGPQVETSAHEFRSAGRSGPASVSTGT